MTAKVLAVIGKGRSGSTLLDRMLGQMPGFVSVGELIRLWDRGLQEGRACGCGVPVPECELWSRVAAAVPYAAESVAADQREVLSVKGAARLLGPSAARRHWPALNRYSDAMSAAYEAIGDVTGERVIVDSSKWVVPPMSLDHGMQTFAVQLVRDPRAVAHSWSHPKRLPERGAGVTLPARGPSRTGLTWLAQNAAASHIRRKLGDRAILLRYEDVVDDPSRSLHQVAELVGEPRGELDFVDEHRVVLGVSHTVAGNPMRFETGAVTIQLDDRWQTEMPNRDRLIVTACTALAMRRYGYRVRRGAPRGVGDDAAAASRT